MRLPVPLIRLLCAAGALALLAGHAAHADKPRLRNFIGVYDGAFTLAADFTDELLTIPARVRIRRMAGDAHTFLVTLESRAGEIPLRAEYVLAPDRSAGASSILPSSNPAIAADGSYQFSKTRLRIVLATTANVQNTGSAANTLRFAGNRLTFTGDVALSFRNQTAGYDFTFLGFRPRAKK